MSNALNPFTENKRKHPAVSIIVPVYNEYDVLPLCLQKLQEVAENLNVSSELIFIDDGSRDGSTDFLFDEMSRDPSIRVIRLSRNFGKEAALTAGLDHALGSAVIVIDADLQDPPELIPDMIEQWHQGADVVLMQRNSREGESWLKKVTAHTFYRLLQKLSHSQIPVDTGDFRLMSRRAVDALKQLPERNRFMKGLFAWVGMPTVILKYDRKPRTVGCSKWDYLDLIRLAMEGITSFSISPLRWTIGIGILAAIIGGCFALWIIIKAIILGDPVNGYPSLISIITFLGGIQLVAIGIVGEYVGKTYIESKQRPNYLIRDIIETPNPAKKHTQHSLSDEIHAKAS